MHVSFQVRKRHESGKLELFRRERKCLHHYLYLIDPEFGFMHVRIQGWIPYECQIYINGREWLARQLDKRGIGYVRYDNSLLAIDDLDAAAELCDHFAHRAWPRVLNAFARLLNPILPAIRAAELRRLLLGARPGRDRHRRDVQDPAPAAGGVARPGPPRQPEHVLRGCARASWAASCTRRCKPRW